MKTVFIVNPYAGKKKNIVEFTNKIHRVAEESKCDVQIYETASVGDAKLFVKKFCSEHGKARFIACGGDGTVSEVINGAIGFDGCEIGVVPMGTGNDFCRNFDADCNFTDIYAQMYGNSEKCDVISYATTVNGKEKNGYCINMFNIGFDCNVADLTNTIKKKSFLGGSFAYFASILINLVKKKGANLKIELDGAEKHNGKLLLTSLANGCYCGGGIKSNPLASLNDGLININIIKNVSRLKFISLLPYYMKGTFLKLRDIDKVISSPKYKKVAITPNTGKMRVGIDGEIYDAEKIEFTCLENGINFVIPKKKATIEDGEKVNA